MNDVCRFTHSMTPNQMSAASSPTTGVSSVFAIGPSSGTMMNTISKKSRKNAMKNTNRLTTIRKPQTPPGRSVSRCSSQRAAVDALEHDREAGRADQDEDHHRGEAASSPRPRACISSAQIGMNTPLMHTISDADVDHADRDLERHRLEREDADRRRDQRRPRPIQKTRCVRACRPGLRATPRAPARRSFPSRRPRSASRAPSAACRARGRSARRPAGCPPAPSSTAPSRAASGPPSGSPAPIPA